MLRIMEYLFTPGPGTWLLGLVNIYIYKFLLEEAEFLSKLGIPRGTDSYLEPRLSSHVMMLLVW
jgi:hypothetical protein